jgi:hypothetical protein
MILRPCGVIPFYPYVPLQRVHAENQRLLPDDLAEALRDTGDPVSGICQRALEQAVRRTTAIRQAVLADLDAAELAGSLPNFTARLVTALGLAVDRAKASSAPAVTTGDLLHGMLAEGKNLALQILTTMDIGRASVIAPSTTEATLPGEGLRFSRPAATALELAVGEAVGLGHNTSASSTCSSVSPASRTGRRRAVAGAGRRRPFHPPRGGRRDSPVCPPAGKHGNTGGGDRPAHGGTRRAGSVGPTNRTPGGPPELAILTSGLTSGPTARDTGGLAASRPAGPATCRSCTGVGAGHR